MTTQNSIDAEYRVIGDGEPRNPNAVRVELEDVVEEPAVNEAVNRGARNGSGFWDKLERAKSYVSDHATRAYNFVGKERAIGAPVGYLVADAVTDGITWPLLGGLAGLAFGKQAYEFGKAKLNEWSDARDEADKFRKLKQKAEEISEQAGEKIKPKDIHRIERIGDEIREYTGIAVKFEQAYSVDFVKRQMDRIFSREFTTQQIYNLEAFCYMQSSPGRKFDPAQIWRVSSHLNWHDSIPPQYQRAPSN